MPLGVKGLKFYKDTEVVCVLEGEVEPHKEGMVEQGENLLFPTDVLHLLLTDDVPFVKDLHYEREGESQHSPEFYRRRLKGEEGVLYTI